MLFLLLLMSWRVVEDSGESEQASHDWRIVTDDANCPPLAQDNNQSPSPKRRKHQSEWQIVKDTDDIGPEGPIVGDTSDDVGPDALGQTTHTHKTPMPVVNLSLSTLYQSLARHQTSSGDAKKSKSKIAVNGIDQKRLDNIFEKGHVLAFLIICFGAFSGI